MDKKKRNYYDIQLKQHYLICTADADAPCHVAPHATAQPGLTHGSIHVWDALQLYTLRNTCYCHVKR